MRVGVYDPTLDRHASTLWVYGEAPVTALKLNQWDGNLAAEFWLLHTALQAFGAPEGDPVLLGPPDSTPLLVTPSDPPDLTLQVLPGLALGPTGVLGLLETAVVPTSGSFEPPADHPRWDLVGLDPAGEWVITAGTPAEDPVLPEAPAEVLPLAGVYLPPGATAITSSGGPGEGTLVDLRPPLLTSRPHTHTQALCVEPADGTRTEFTLPSGFRAGTLELSVNGLVQVPDLHFTAHPEWPGCEFMTPPAAGSVLLARYERS